MNNRDEKYFYAKERRKFGRQCIFADHNELIFDEPPNRDTMNEYILKNPVEKSTQLHTTFALSEVLTINPEMKARGMLHSEGGWPKDLNANDEEQTTRYRKKIMREDNWGQKVPELLAAMEKSVLQNGAVNIYENYFENMAGIPLCAEFSGKTVNIYKDKKEPPRPLSSLTWSPDGLSIGGSYSTTKFTESANLDTTSFVWNIENPNKPMLTLTPKTAIMSLQYNSKDQFLLAGGLLSGQVAIWDQRSGGLPILISEREVAHSDRVNSLLWTSSKTNTEFFSGSADGSVYFWDTRNIANPTEQMFMDPIETNEQEKSRSYGVSVVEFEPTIPTRFMVGSDQGYIFTCNRKGRTATERIMARFKTNAGTIYSLERNSAFPKNFLTVGDWAAKIYSDEWRDQPIVWMSNQKVPIFSGTWSKTRCSLFFLTKQDGSFEAWDLLIDQQKPIIRIKLAPNPLLCCASHDNGQFVAVAGSNGYIYLVQISDNLVTSSKLERPAYSLMMDRETKREKAYDSRLREIKLKIRQEQEKQEAMEALADAEDAKDDKVNMISGQEKELAEQKAKELQKKAEEKALKEKQEQEEMERKKAEAAAAAPADQEGQDDLVARSAPPPSSAEDEEAEVVIDLTDEAEKDFYAQVEKEINKRQTYEVLPVLTPFDPGFDLRTIMKPEDIEKEHKEHIQIIKDKIIKGLLNLKRGNIKLNDSSTGEAVSRTNSEDETEDEE